MQEEKQRGGGWLHGNLAASSLPRCFLTVVFLCMCVELVLVPSRVSRVDIERKSRAVNHESVHPANIQKIEQHAHGISRKATVQNPMNKSSKGAYVPPHRRGTMTTMSYNNAPSFSTRAPEILPNSYHNYNDNLSILTDALARVCCINLKQRPNRWKSFQKQALRVGSSFLNKVERFAAVDGKQVLENGDAINNVQMEWDATINASYSRKVTRGKRVMLPGEVGCALSHIDLWRELAATDGNPHTTTMLILEDDAVFSTYRNQTRFAAAFANAWKQLPDDWSILYLGLSDRGERTYIDLESNNRRPDPVSNPQVRLYHPTYGYHTHAYVINKATAQKLLKHLPIVGPIDVWFADNNWFDMPVYCAVIAREGWRLDDGTYEGMDLVTQNRGKGFESDVLSHHDDPKQK